MVPVDNGSFWMRQQWRNGHTGEITWSAWEIVHLANHPHKQNKRVIMARFWSENLERFESKYNTAGLLVEFQRIKAPKTT